MQAAVIASPRKGRSCDASLWMNLFLFALPVLLVVALAALGLWLFTHGGRSRT